VPHNLLPGQAIPVPLSKFQMTPLLRFIISSGSKKKEPRCACLSETKASHSHKIWTEVSSSVPHFLQVCLLLNPITNICFLGVLLPVRKPVTTLDCVLLEYSNRAFVAGLGPETLDHSHPFLFHQRLVGRGVEETSLRQCQELNRDSVVIQSICLSLH
jgi:hypothetical protein